MSAPLSSLKILDFSTLLPGPFASMILADLGADVLRIESPTRPDLVRLLPPIKNGISAAHMTLNRSKRSLALDLKKEEAVDIVMQLLADYDIVLEQFRPGVMKRLGLGYEDLKKQNPAVIFCSLTGYGQTGPYHDRAGHDLNYLAFSGVSHYSRRTNESPVPLGIQTADLAGGSHHAVMGIMAAVIHRNQTGEGQAIDISMTDAMLTHNVFSGSELLANGKSPQPESTWLNGGSFYDYYKTADERWISVSSLEPQFMTVLLEIMELPANLINTSMNDVDAQKQLKKTLQTRFLERSWQEWKGLFEGKDVCVELVHELNEALEHEHFQAREMIAKVPLEDGTFQPQIGSAFKFSAYQTEYKNAGGKLGEHTEEVLKELNYSNEKIKFLIKSGICSD